MKWRSFKLRQRLESVLRGIQDARRAHPEVTSQSRQICRFPPHQDSVSNVARWSVESSGYIGGR